MAKYYSMDQTQQKLGLNEDRIRQLVQTGQLHQYRDAGKAVFPAQEVDNLASKQDTGEITLEPVEEGEELPAGEKSGADVISLEQVEDLEGKGGTRAGAKDDTVITSVGISVFDDDELPAAADPMAKTQISKQADEPDVALESIGSSGSGLLDLTRESDDTSLGAELLDEIYPEEEETISEEPIVAAEPEPAPAAPVPSQMAEPAAMVAAPAMVAVAVDDPAGPIFTGLTVVSILLLGLVGVVSAAEVQGVWPGFLELLYQNSLFVLIGSAVLAGFAALMGWLVARRAARPVAAAPEAQ